MLLVVLGGAASAQVVIDVGGIEFQGVLGPPAILGGRQCGSSRPVTLSLTGGMPGRLYEVYEYDPAGQKVGAFVGSFVVAPNAEGATLGQVAFSAPDMSYVARQRDLSGQASGYSPSFTLPWPPPAYKPSVAPEPLWTCGTATGIAGHAPGDSLKLKSGWPFPVTRSTVSQAIGTHEYVPAGGGGPFQQQEVLFAEARSCAGTEYSAFVYATQHPMATLPQLQVDGASATPGAEGFLVRNVVNGAALSLSLVGASGSVQWVEHCAWNPCRAFPPTGPLAEGDTITATQVLCPGTASPPTTLVTPDCSLVPPPQVAASPYIGDTTLALRSFAPGATIVVLATSESDPRLGHAIVGVAPAATLVPLLRAVEPTDRWIIVTQVTSACEPRSGSAWQVLD